MKAPDKIYLATGNLGSLIASCIKGDERDVEYIRKDALLEWAKKEQELTISIREDAWWDGVINKLKSM